MVATRHPIRLTAILFITLSLSSCGYRVAGRSTILPPATKTIAVLALQNKTTQYRIEQRLTNALVHEFLARTSYRIVPNPEGADAVLSGEIDSIETSAVLFDTATGRVTTVLVTVTLGVRLVDSATRRTLYENPAYLFRQEYEVSTDVPSFFDEKDPALDRLARDFASALLAAVLEGF